MAEGASWQYRRQVAKPWEQGPRRRPQCPRCFRRRSCHGCGIRQWHPHAWKCWPCCEYPGGARQSVVRPRLQRDHAGAAILQGNWHQPPDVHYPFGARHQPRELPHGPPRRHDRCLQRHGRRIAIVLAPCLLKLRLAPDVAEFRVRHLRGRHGHGYRHLRKSRGRGHHEHYRAVFLHRDDFGIRGRLGAHVATLHRLSALFQAYYTESTAAGSVSTARGSVSGTPDDYQRGQ
mmetsp:Transcript_131656/g.366929  ORF Transcript_131656/g.366929 Transcript_131656/m.366929 type:complete len:232 (+) Transcript_131656:283-978(+)